MSRHSDNYSVIKAPRLFCNVFQLQLLYKVGLLVYLFAILYMNYICRIQWCRITMLFAPQDSSAKRAAQEQIFSLLYFEFALFLSLILCSSSAAACLDFLLSWPKLDDLLAYFIYDIGLIELLGLKYNI